jgi:hypothetical protein
MKLIDIKNKLNQIKSLLIKLMDTHYGNFNT